MGRPDGEKAGLYNGGHERIRHGEIRSVRGGRRRRSGLSGWNQLAEMGKLAAGLAHELKNPLSTLKLNLQLLEEDLAALLGA